MSDAASTFSASPEEIRALGEQGLYDPSRNTMPAASVSSPTSRATARTTSSSRA